MQQNKHHVYQIRRFTPSLVLLLLQYKKKIMFSLYRYKSLLQENHNIKYWLEMTSPQDNSHYNRFKKYLDKEDWYWTKIHTSKLLQVHTKLNELLRNNNTIHIDKGIIITLSSKYEKVQDIIFKVNKVYLQEIADGFDLTNFSKQVLVENTKDILRLIFNSRDRSPN